LNDVGEGNVGVYSLEMKVTDQLGAFSQYSFAIQIKAIEPPPPSTPEPAAEPSQDSSSEQDDSGTVNSNNSQPVISNTPGLQPILIRKNSGGYSTFTPMFDQENGNAKEEKAVQEIRVPKNTTAFIESISVKGLMQIKFNFEMMTGFNLTLLNSSLINMYVIPIDARHLEDLNFNISKLNFTWEPVSFKKDVLEIQLYFECPTCISPNLQQDRIVVDLRNATATGFFYSPENEFKGLHKKF
jgi:hypothetical protein